VEESSSSHRHPVQVDIGFSVPFGVVTTDSFELNISILIEEITKDLSRVIGGAEGSPIGVATDQETRLP
jgi:hypothetical protein